MNHITFQLFISSIKRILCYIGNSVFAGQGCDSDLPNSGNGMLDNSCDESHETTVDISTIEQSERCCRKHGICSHEILQDESSDSSFKITGRKVARKVNHIS